MTDGALDAGSPTDALLECGAALSAYLDEISVGLHAKLTDADLLAEIGQLERQARRLASAWHSLITQAEQRLLPQRIGATSTSAMLQSLLRLSPTEAKQRVMAAAVLAPRVGLTGESLPPLLPVVADAQRGGEISAEHARVITRTMERIPAGVALDLFDAAERSLTSAAQELRPREVGQLGERLLAHLDPDGVLQSDAEHERRRVFDLIPLADGSYRAHGYLTPDCGAQLLAAISPRSAPAPTDDDVPDPRTPAQRRHDALAELAGLTVRRNELVEGRGTTQLIITMTADQLASGEGLAETSFGQFIPAREALRLADEAALAFLLRDARGAVLAEGRSRRLATRSQSLALIARDKGCSFPGCDRPPDWTQRHHVLSWMEGGPTDVDNLTLLCGSHHRNFERWGWCCRMIDGLPWWIPPPWLDRQQRPRLNTRIRPARSPSEDRRNQPRRE